MVLAIALGIGAWFIWGRDSAMLADAALAVLGATPPDAAEATTLELLKNRNDSISSAAAAAADRKKAAR